MVMRADAAVWFIPESKGKDNECTSSQDDSRSFYATTTNIDAKHGLSGDVYGREGRIQ